MNVLFNNEAILLNQQILWAEEQLHLAETNLSNFFFIIEGQYERNEKHGLQTNSQERKTFYFEIVSLNRRIEAAKANVAALPTFTNL